MYVDYMEKEELLLTSISHTESIGGAAIRAVSVRSLAVVTGVTIVSMVFVIVAITGFEGSDTDATAFLFVATTIRSTLQGEELLFLD